jgi:uncharacterized protein
MELKDEIRINAPRAKVFSALNDPEILRQAIPGCEELAALSPTEFTATVAAKVGPLSTRFKGAVTLADIRAPESYTLSGEGKGGPAGFAKVRAQVHLAEDGATTVLSYSVKADIGGKLGQLGGSLVDRTAQKLAGEFFQKFEALVGTPVPAKASDRPPNSPPAPVKRRRPTWWFTAAAMIYAVIWYFMNR